MAIHGFLAYVNDILRNFSSEGRDEQVAVISLFLGLLLVLVAVVLFVVL